MTRLLAAACLLTTICAGAQEPSGNLSSPMGRPQDPRTAEAKPAKAQPAKAAPAPQRASVKVEKILAAAGIKDREAFGVADVFGHEFDLVYCWTRLSVSSPPVKVKFVWSKDGRQAAVQSREIKSSGRWWAMKQVSPGSWTVEVRSESGDMLGAVEFRVNER